MSVSKTLTVTISTLTTHVSAICTDPLCTVTDMESDISKTIQDLGKIIYNQSLSSDELTSLARINLLAKTFYLMLSERLLLQQRIEVNVSAEHLRQQKFNDVLGFERSPPSSGTFPTRKGSRRLSKEQRSILEEWYGANSENPYLSNSATNTLVKMTNLSVNQVRNWYVHLLFAG